MKTNNASEIKNKVEATGAKVIRIASRLGKVTVTIPWGDYLKVRRGFSGVNFSLK